jgi:hypothetical protein
LKEAVIAGYVGAFLVVLCDECADTLLDAVRASAGLEPKPAPGVGEAEIRRQADSARLREESFSMRDDDTHKPPVFGKHKWTDGGTGVSVGAWCENCGRDYRDGGSDVCPGVLPVGAKPKPAPCARCGGTRFVKGNHGLRVPCPDHLRRARK